MITVNSYQKLIGSWNLYSKDFVSDITKEFDSYNELLEKRRNEKISNSKIGFNIFSAISEKYYYENYTSDLLKLILDPKTPEIGNPEYLNLFLNELVEIPKEGAFQNINEIQVLREEHKIDILIHDAKDAIIIESKLNDAIDQPNQLAKYYNKIKNENLVVRKVVYLTIDSHREPHFKYTEDKDFKKKEFDSCIKSITDESVFRHIYAVSDSSRDKTLTSFLKDCAEKATNGLSKTVVLQYKKLLEKIGGELRMLEPEKQLIAEIFSNQEKIKNANDFAEVWDKKDQIIKQLIHEKIKNAINWKFLEKQKHQWEDTTLYLSLKDKVRLYYDQSISQIGFELKPGLTKAKAQLLLNLFQELNYGELTIIGEPDYDLENGWVYFNFEFDKEPIPDLCKKIENFLEELFKASKEL